MNFFEEAPLAVTICDNKGKILAMNKKSVKTFVKPGESIIGNSLMDCHPKPAKDKLEKMLQTHEVNAYTIEKNGIKKMIYQAPWYQDGKFMGYIELSLELPDHLPHFVRG